MLAAAATIAFGAVAFTWAQGPYAWTADAAFIACIVAFLLLITAEIGAAAARYITLNHEPTHGPHHHDHHPRQARQTRHPSRSARRTSNRSDRSQSDRNR